MYLQPSNPVLVQYFVFFIGISSDDNENEKKFLAKREKHFFSASTPSLISIANTVSCCTSTIISSLISLIEITCSPLWLRPVYRILYSRPVILRLWFEHKDLLNKPFPAPVFMIVVVRDGIHPERRVEIDFGGCGVGPSLT